MVPFEQKMRVLKKEIEGPTLRGVPTSNGFISTTDLSNSLKILGNKNSKCFIAVIAEGIILQQLVLNPATLKFCKETLAGGPVKDDSSVTCSSCFNGSPMAKSEEKFVIRK